LHLNQGRNARRQRRWLASAATLLLAVSAAWLVRNGDNSAAVESGAQPIVAVVSQLQGAAALNEANLVASDRIRAGDVLRTRDVTGARVELSNGVSVRVAANTEVKWVAADALELTQGELYVDSHANAAPLTIHTLRGDVTHLGTRYLVAVGQQSLRVAVREGKVSVRANQEQFTIDSLQQLQMGGDGVASRNDLQLDDATWQWADALAQPFVLENRSLAEFLQWVAGETGCELSYVSPAVKAAAANTVLHGQLSTQAPLQTMRSVLDTTDFHAVLNGRRLLVTQQR
jgi:ferric-dicitrate binding protein FerR (iron transport regulator)